MHLHQGNLDEARKCSRRAELLRLQEGIEERYAASTIASEVLGHSLLGDLFGIKSKLDALDALAAQRPGWRPIACYGLGRYRELQGDLPGALAAIDEGLALIEPSRHAFFCHLAASQVDVLVAEGKIAEAVSAARAHMQSAEQARHLLTKHTLYVSAALAFASAGERDEAVRLIDAAIEAAVGFGSTGFALGRIYEVRAKVALLLGQPDEFERYVSSCASEYEQAHNPALGARLAALVEQGRRNFAGPSEAPAAVLRLLYQQETPSEYESVHSRMLECVDEADRGRCALTLLLQSTECSAGALFLVDGEGALRMLSTLPEANFDPGLAAWLERFLEGEQRAGVTQSVADDADTDELDDPTAYVDGEGRRFEASALVLEQDERPRIVALLALQVGSGLRMQPPQQLCHEIALSLALGEEEPAPAQS
jgi:tetratricopeptide (TPR) repeat protein